MMIDPPSDSFKRLPILVCDDDADVRDFYKLVLAEFFELTFARDGLEAWRILETFKPRLILTDLNMPGMNGLELTDKIKSNLRLRNTPVIIITGATRGSDLPPGFWKIGTQANAFLEKPIVPSELIAEMRKQILLHANITPLPPGRGSYGTEG
jgi:CheY-like chemotaxis protein